MLGARGGVPSIEVGRRVDAQRRLVLVIDDEPWVRATARRMLEHLGYSVVEAADGKAGLDAFGARLPEISAVLVDMTMPEMSGEEVLRELRRVGPDVPVIVSSGFTDGEATLRLSGERSVAFLEKPYTVQQLAKLMAELTA
jgi:two-component system, cell cycle sensor histidine kinase and response regulator CckA